MIYAIMLCSPSVLIWIPLACRGYTDTNVARDAIPNSVSPDWLRMLLASTCIIMSYVQNYCIHFFTDKLFLQNSVCNPYMFEYNLTLFCDGLKLTLQGVCTPHSPIRRLGINFNGMAQFY